MSLSRFAGQMLCLLLVCLTACAQVSIRNVWRDPDYAGPPLQRVIVLAVSQSDVQRRVFEDTFVAHLQQQGIDAQVSYRMLPDNGPQSTERMRSAFAGSGAQAVLTTRVIQVDQRINITPSPYWWGAWGPGFYGPGYYGPGFSGWYGPAWYASPADVYQYSVLTLETSLWNISTGKLVWTASSQLVDPDNISGMASSVAETVSHRMREDGVL